MQCEWLGVEKGFSVDTIVLTRVIGLALSRPNCPWLLLVPKEMQMVTKDVCANEGPTNQKNLLLLADQSVGWLPTLLHLLHHLHQDPRKNSPNRNLFPSPRFGPGCNLVFPGM